MTRIESPEAIARRLTKRAAAELAAVVAADGPKRCWSDDLWFRGLVEAVNPRWRDTNMAIATGLGREVARIRAEGADG